MIARVLCVIALASLCTMPAARAQTKPKLTDVGVENPKTSIYIGNSFFYYNNSMHSHVAAMNRAADPNNKSSYRSTSVTMRPPRSSLAGSSISRCSTPSARRAPSS